MEVNLFIDSANDDDLGAFDYIMTQDEVSVAYMI